MDREGYDLLERVLIHEAFNQAEEIYPLWDLENSSSNGLYCRIARPKPVQEIRTYRIDLSRLESFNLL